MAETLRRFIIVLFLVAFLQACGSGGGSGGGGQGSTLPTRTLSWDRPTQYVDNTNIPSAALVDEYRIYIKSGNMVFSDSDAYYTLLEWNPDPVDPAYKIDLNSAEIVSYFNLKKGTTYYLKMRTVVSGVLSDFSENTISFNFDNNLSVIY